MKLSRRRFIHHTLTMGSASMTFWMHPGSLFGDDECQLPAGGQGTEFIPNEPQVVDRISASEMAASGSPTLLQHFREAVGLMRNMPPGKPKNILPNDVRSWTKQIAQHCMQCALANTSNIHFSEYFLPWHRGLLYFVEKILRTQSGYDDLRLPYWDWENERTLPSIYAPQNQPLYWGNRNLGNLTADDVDVQPLLGIPSFDDFGGTATVGTPTPAVFGGPHANVHDAFAGDMQDLQYSPRDPVFYAHHANIDRLWSSWIAFPHPRPDFGTTAKVYFYDDNKKWRFVLLNNLRDETRLGYKYSSLMKPGTFAPHSTLFTMQKNNDTFALSETGTATLRVRPEGAKILLVRNIRNLANFSSDIVRYGIFLGAPQVGSTAASADGYLGKVARVASSGHSEVGTLTAALNVTSKISRLAAGNEAPLQLTIAPLDRNLKIAASGIPLDADSVSIIG
jgi:hypothetical protein